MSLRDRAVTTVYLAYSIQAMAQAIIWQWMTFFVKHDLLVDDFLVLTFAWSAPALVVMVAGSLLFPDKEKPQLDTEQKGVV